MSENKSQLLLAGRSYLIRSENHPFDRDEEIEVLFVHDLPFETACVLAVCKILGGVNAGEVFSMIRSESYTGWSWTLTLNGRLMTVMYPLDPKIGKWS